MLSKAASPARPPIGSTQFLLGLQHAEEYWGRRRRANETPGGESSPPTSTSLTALLLQDAPEGGVCKP